MQYFKEYLVIDFLLNFLVYCHFLKLIDFLFFTTYNFICYKES